MELCIMMQIVAMDAENSTPVLYIEEEGSDEVVADTEPRFFTADDLSGITYQEVSFDVDETQCVLVRFTVGEETLYCTATEETFEDMLAQIGLNPEEQEIDFSNIDQSVNEEDSIIEENVA